MGLKLSRQDPARVAPSPICAPGCASTDTGACRLESHVHSSGSTEAAELVPTAQRLPSQSPTRRSTRSGGGWISATRWQVEESDNESVVSFVSTRTSSACDLPQQATEQDQWDGSGSFVFGSHDELVMSTGAAESERQAQLHGFLSPIHRLIESDCHPGAAGLQPSRSHPPCVFAVAASASPSAAKAAPAAVGRVPPPAVALR